MSDLSILSDNMANGENTPLPLIVAHRWNFPLAHVQTEDGMFYAVQDWMRGLSGEENIRYLLSNFKKTEVGKQMWFSTLLLPYKAKDGKTYKRDYTTDKGLYPQSCQNYRTPSAGNQRIVAARFGNRQTAVGGSINFCNHSKFLF
jgi:hypothetical protein